MKRTIKVYFNGDESNTDMLVRVLSEMTHRACKIHSVSYTSNELTMELEGIDLNHMVKVLTQMHGVSKVI